MMTDLRPALMLAALAVVLSFAPLDVHAEVLNFDGRKVEVVDGAVSDEDARFVVDYAQRLYRRGEYQDASRALRELRRRYGGEVMPRLLHLYGKSEFMQGDVRYAIKLWARQLDAYPDARESSKQELGATIVNAAQRLAETINQKRKTVDPGEIVFGERPPDGVLTPRLRELDHFMRLYALYKYSYDSVDPRLEATLTQSETRLVTFSIPKLTDRSDMLRRISKSDQAVISKYQTEETLRGFFYHMGLYGVGPEFGGYLELETDNVSVKFYNQTQGSGGASTVLRALDGKEMRLSAGGAAKTWEEFLAKDITADLIQDEFEDFVIEVEYFWSDECQLESAPVSPVRKLPEDEVMGFLVKAPCLLKARFHLPGLGELVRAKHGSLTEWTGYAPKQDQL